MTRRFFRTVVLTGALASAGIAASAGAAMARTGYDGSWSVLIITQSGACGPSYRYGVEINNGSVFYAGGGPVSLQGRVARNGAVHVTLSAGEQRAYGSGPPVALPRRRVLARPGNGRHVRRPMGGRTARLARPVARVEPSARHAVAQRWAKPGTAARPTRLALHLGRATRVIPLRPPQPPSAIPAPALSGLARV